MADPMFRVAQRLGAQPRATEIRPSGRNFSPIEGRSLLTANLAPRPCPPERGEAVRRRERSALNRRPSTRASEP